MKKKALLFLGAATVATTCLFGCGTTDEEAVAVEPTTEEATTEEATTEETATEEAATEEATTEEATEEKTLEAYYTQPAMKAALDKQMETQKESMKDMYSDIAVDFVGNEIIYTYTTVADFDAAVSEDQIESQLKNMADSLIGALRTEAGVAEGTPVTMTFKYLKSTGEEIAVCSFTDPEVAEDAATEETEEAPAEDAAAEETVEE